jgi:hypothetical protein
MTPDVNDFRAFEDPPALKCLDEYLRTHITDDRTLRYGLDVLRIRNERAGWMLGVRVTLRYMLEHNELPRENRPEPQISLVPDETLGQRYGAD